MGGQNRRSPLIGAGWGVLLAAFALTGCSGAVDGKIVRAHGSSDSATLSLTVSACELKYNVDVAQDSEQVRVRVTGHRSGNGSPDCAMGVLVLLRDPLGSRTVIDETTGKAVTVDAPVPLP
jgi:hypothetical protein